MHKEWEMAKHNMFTCYQEEEERYRDVTSKVNWKETLSVLCS